MKSIILHSNRIDNFSRKVLFDAAIGQLLNASLGPGGSFGNTPTSGASASLNFSAPSNGGGTSQPVVNTNTPAPSNNTSNSSGGGYQKGGWYPTGPGGQSQMWTGSGWTTDPGFLSNYQSQGQQNAQQQLDARNAQIKSSISSAYQPIFDAFDNQIGLLPQQQSDAEKQVGDLATGQKSDVTAERDRNVSDLQSNIDTENNQANMNLNDLSSNIQNMLKGAAFYLGSLGAGNSSAAGDYTTAITNNADKTRGQILNTRDLAVHQINQKIGDVNSLASQNLNDIDTWKNNQLTTIAQEFRKQLSDLQMGKASAQGQEGKDIASLQQSALDNFYSRLQQLDDTVYNYKAAISQWQTERAGWLQDQLTLMKQGASYNSTTNPQQQQLIQSLLQQGNGTQSTPTSNTSATPGSGAITTNQNPLQNLVSGVGNILGSGASAIGNLFNPNNNQ